MFDILLPVDSSTDRALAAAKLVTDYPHASEPIHVTILNVEPAIDVVGGDGGAVDSAEWYDENDVPESVREAAELLEEAGIDVTVKRTHADPAEAIVAVANERGVDQIVMTGRKRSPTGKAIFGSTTQTVLLQSEIPVLVHLTDSFTED